RLARLDVDDGDGMAGVGEHHGNAARHAAGAETGNCLASAHLKPWASRALRPAASRWSRRRLANVRPRAEKSSPQMAEPMARNARASGVGTPASSPTEARNDSPMATSSRM